MVCCSAVQLRLPLPEFDHWIPGAPRRPSQRVFCNRSLRFEAIEWIGFDMDYTLAIYRQEAMNAISMQAAARKLVERGWTDALLHLPQRADFPVRGLIIDKELGNVLKVDRYLYVKRAYHGFEELSKAQRRRTYHTQLLRFDRERFHWIDTLYGVSEVALYAAAVDTIEKDGLECDHRRLFEDVRACMDECHQDGSILGPITGDLPRYVEKDPQLPKTLHQLRSSGKRLFLLTNSGADYTEAMMAHLLDGALPEYASWRGYFDLTICAARKPAFFSGDAPFRLAVSEEVAELDGKHLFEGGNLEELEEYLGVAADHVLYVGDHIYGDALRAKKSTVWRTAMILQEMEGELRTQHAMSKALERLDALATLQRRLTDALREHQGLHRQLLRKQGDWDVAQAAEAHRRRRAISLLRQRLRSSAKEYDTLEGQVAEAFHPYWGSVFKAGPEVSSFGNQVEDFACLYTARASNLGLYSTVHYFQSPRDHMPHELRR